MLIKNWYRSLKMIQSAAYYNVGNVHPSGNTHIIGLIIPRTNHIIQCNIGMNRIINSSLTLHSVITTARTNYIYPAIFNNII